MYSRTANCVPSRLLFEEKGFATVARLAKQEASESGVSEEKTIKRQSSTTQTQGEKCLSRWANQPE